MLATGSIQLPIKIFIFPFYLLAIVRDILPVWNCVEKIVQWQL